MEYKKIPKPSYYTLYEGGSWNKWPANLELHRGTLNKRDDHSIAIDNNIRVHSIAFGEIAMGLGKFARWDCINGWTDTPREILY